MGKSLILVVLAAVSLSANIHTVPADYATIQSAIEASVNGDTVVVFPGTYFENINFHGKNVVVTSRFFESNDMQYILQTIINGSKPNHPDTASCVLIVSGENSSAVLQGFTLTGGKGTRWTDEHGAGIYREGGGILVTVSSPVIRYNYIINNEIFNTGNVTSTGGAGIRIGDGGGIVENNVITLNKAMYGGGIVLNYCSGTIVRNNLILENTVRQYDLNKQAFGGGGIWMGSPKPGDASSNIIENNTFIGNVALDNSSSSSLAGRGGAMIIHSKAKAIVRNNIMWQNHSAFPISALAVLGGSPQVEYNDIMGGYPGTGNIDADPQFADTAFVLKHTSPCIDAGDTSSVFSDPLDAEVVRYPAQGTARNDMGAYGGPRSISFFAFSRPSVFLPLDLVNFGLMLPGDSVTVGLTVVNFGSKTAVIDSIRLPSGDFSAVAAMPMTLDVNTLASIPLQLKPLEKIQYKDTMFVYHNSTFMKNPYTVLLRGNAIPTPLMSVNLLEHNFGVLDINTPSKDTTIYIYNLGTGKDSIRITLNPFGVKPADALKLSASAFTLAPGDSQAVTFTLYPQQVTKTLLGVYSPKILFKSFFGEDTATVEKTMRFKLTGTLGAGEYAVSPMEYVLEQNYPNPFNPSTSIRFTIAAEGFVLLKVYDILGNEVSTVINERMSVGEHRVAFNAEHLASGVYVYRLTSGKFTSIKKMTVIK
ncbi:MAG: choice-of-anchor D domain-containing protein [Bacteroidota bacterium]